MAQLQQFWCYGFSNPNYTHTAKLELEKPTNSSSTTRLPAPKLNDLLNPLDPDEANPTFDIRDPYGAAELEKDDEDSEEEQGHEGQTPPPHEQSKPLGTHSLAFQSGFLHEDGSEGEDNETSPLASK